MKSLQSVLQLPLEEREQRGLVHTPREIAQQPDTWLETTSIFQENAERLQGFLEAAGVRGPVESRPVVFLVGAGTSDYIGRSLVLLLRESWECEVIACPSTDLLPNMDSYVVPGRRYVWISFSRSGDSPEGLAVIQQAVEKYPQIAQLVITCNKNARMIAACNKAGNGCVVVLGDATNDRSLAMTSSFTNMVVMGHCLAHAWSFEQYAPVLEQLVAGARALLEPGFAVAQELAARRDPQLCFVGTGSLAAVATESALKVLEMSAGQVKTISETTLGLRHGPMAILSRETLFVSFLSSDPRREGYGKDLLEEIGRKDIASARIAVGLRSRQAQVESACDIFVALDASVPDNYRAPLDVILGQLLGVCIAMEHGSHPDAPSPDGVIHRVVQDFAIYG